MSEPPHHLSQCSLSPITTNLYDSLLGRLLLHGVGEACVTRKKEMVYAGPEGGIAQVALAYAAFLNGKKATVFLNTYLKPGDQVPPLVRLAAALGANIKLPIGTGRSLKDTQADATKYVAEDAENRALMPFGLRGKPGEANFDLFREALMEALGLAPGQGQGQGQGQVTIHQAPKRLWLVAGSGFLLDVLHSIWPTTTFMVVQVGKRIWPDQLENKLHQLFIAPEHFGDTALSQPPYATVPWYDAKLWQFASQHWQPGDCIWNVGSVPKDPEQMARDIIAKVQVVEESMLG